jgi:dihydroneopterin aldolase
MWVIKLGGSLARSPLLPSWLDTLADHGGGRVVVVPGGGPFADLVRAEQLRMGFDDDAAHWMAILAMEQYGFMLAASRPRFRVAALRAELDDVLIRGLVPVWLAYPMVVRDTGLPRTWDVSADSLALWLARELGADTLLLVKSVAVRGERADIGALVRAKVVDAHFPRLARGYAGALRILGPDASATLAQGLRAGIAPGAELEGADG